MSWKQIRLIELFTLNYTIVFPYSNFYNDLLLKEAQMLIDRVYEGQFKVLKKSLFV